MLKNVLENKWKNFAEILWSFTGNSLFIVKKMGLLKCHVLVKHCIPFFLAEASRVKKLFV